VAIDSIDDLQILLIACEFGTVDEVGKPFTRFFFIVLLTVHLSIILVIDQLNAQTLVIKQEFLH